MKKLTQIRIVAVHERTLIVRNRGLDAGFRCTVCPEGAPMITPTSAAALSMQTIRAIYRWIETGKIHYYEGPEGLLICLESLALAKKTFHL